MKVALITFEDSKINFLKKLSSYLSSKIANLSIHESALDSPLDLPKKLASLKGYDLIFVSYFYAKESMQIKIALEKLVDFELSSGIPIVKAIGLFDEDSEETEDELALKYGKQIAKKLLGFIPQ